RDVVDDLPAVNLDTGLPMWGPMKDPKPDQVTSPAVAQTSPGKPIQRWSAARKRDVVPRLLRGESIGAVARQIGIEPYRLEQWRERALVDLESALKERLSAIENCRTTALGGHVDACEDFLNSKFVPYPHRLCEPQVANQHCQAFSELGVSTHWDRCAPVASLTRRCTTLSRETRGFVLRGLSYAYPVFADSLR